MSPETGMSTKLGQQKRHSSLIKAFADALRGVRVAASGQRNFRIHLVAAAFAVALGFATGLHPTEWVLLFLTIGLVLALEAINTALEKLVDLISPEYNPLAGQVKDLAAGAVLIAAFAAVLTGIIIFVPKIISIFQ